MREKAIRPSALEVNERGGAHLMHNIDKELSGVFREVIGQFGSILVRGDRFDLRNDFVRNQVSVSLYVDVGIDW